MITALTQAASAITAALGEGGTYTVKATTATHAVRVIIERDIATPVNSMAGYISERHTAISLPSAILTAASLSPVIGDTITVGSEVWIILAIDQDDGYITRLRVRK